MKKTSLLCFLLVAFASAKAAPVSVERPNIILLMTDDQGYGDLGIAGNPIVETPNLDALARRSATLSNFYVSPVCAPTRASLMTGRYNYRTRVVDTWKGRAMMEPSEVTIAEVLKQAGYLTGIFGKWHLGDCYPMRPMDQGFEESLVLRGGGLAQPSEPIANARHYTDPILFHNGKEVASHGYCTDVYFDAAMKFIDRARSAGKPFFIYLPPNAPHGPFHDVPMDLYEKYRHKDLTPVLLGHTQDADMVARVYAMVENIDQNVGRLMAKLKATGLWDNTLVIFMADNGPASVRYVGPFRGKKTEVHDGGIRSPFFVQWPARLRPGTRSDRIAAHIDVMPTLLEAAGVPVPAGLNLDGRSLLPLLEGRQVAWPDRTLVLQIHRGDTPVSRHQFAIRNQRWGLVHSTGFGREMPPPNVPYELYDLTADSRETNNLAAQHPEIVAQLERAYNVWFDDVSHTRPHNFAPPRIVVGTDHETRTVLTWQDWRVTERGGWGRQGKWLLHLAGEHTYDIEFRWPKTIAPGTLVLHIGSQQQTLAVPQATANVVVQKVRIPAGDADLWATVKRDTEWESPYHVVLIRR